MTLALTSAACVLAASSAGFASWRPAAAGERMHVASAAKTPGLYRVVFSPIFTAHHQSQSQGTVTCPAGTVVFCGGVLDGNSTALNVNSSFPLGDGSGWAADVNNAGAADTSFQVQAVCAKKPRKYQVIESGAFAVIAGSQASGAQTCPKRTVVLGGGSTSSSSSVNVNINSTYPFSDGSAWLIWQNNTSSSGSTFAVFAICGHSPRGYNINVGLPTPNPPFQQANASVPCGAGKPLSGGAFSSANSNAVDMSSSVPAGASSWSVDENNTGFITGATIQAYAVCA
jgi:hypothetical protein